jgi:DNA-binding transcriptional ArsR family regulator
VKLSPQDAKRLSSLVLQGPPRTQYRPELSEQEYLEIKDRAISLRLMKLREGGLLTQEVEQRLEEIFSRHPDWSRSTSERDEFPMWIGGAESGDRYDFEAQLADYRGWSDDQVIMDLRTNPNAPETVARWRDLLLDDTRRTIGVLDTLGTSEFFETEIWGLALQHLRREEWLPDCVRLYSTFGSQLGPGFVSKHLYDLTEVVNLYCHGKNQEQDDALWRLWDLAFELATEVVSDDHADPVFAALNSPIGRLTEALLAKLVLNCINQSICASGSMRTRPLFSTRRVRPSDCRLPQSHRSPGGVVGVR